MTLTKILSAVSACAIATAAAAKVQTRKIEYRQGDTVLHGFLAWDDAAKGKRPGVLVVHEWWGQNEHARNQARRLAKAGYVGFALDMYGNGKVTTHPKDAMAFAQEATKDPQVVAARFDAALAVLKQQPQVDPEKIAAFGYCFGGGVALRMARAGEDLGAVVTFHGALEPALGPAEPGKIKPAILVQTGGADPMVPPEQVQQFEQEMKDSGAKVEVITYPGAKHSFTNPDANKAGVEGLAYDHDADVKSWSAAMKFLKQVFGT
ncbi:dienelactone hydrolase family protein [Anaeromyxobacter oryzae]|uniref:Dienelactone hydrolase n=1 Tax=Anaeromyxobacter oryzae TaxID=2918170 RepID=A0ABN6MWP6_9BACT|nr:dienelactone hydrolase family protein [Anaeromyxobacter oryzae]BDG05331.1 dienelactone hydrolase [Anaeromyxobacter oryzae]